MRVCVASVGVPSACGNGAPHARGSLSRNGKAPALVTVYGAFGASKALSWNPDLLVLLSRGCVRTHAFVCVGVCMFMSVAMCYVLCACAEGLPFACLW